MYERYQHVVTPAIGVGVFVITFSSVVLLTKIFGDLCWPTRFGGILVGLAVFAHGYVYANKQSLRRTLRTGLTVEQHVMHVANVASVFGTFMWALGDLLPPLFGMAFCKAG